MTTLGRDLHAVSPQHQRISGLCAIGAGLAAFVYAVAFLGLVLTGVAPTFGFGLASFLLLAGSLLGGAALTALYPRLRRVDPGFALLALLLGVGGTMGAAVHGGFDLANVLQPPGDVAEASQAGLPNYVDPRGLLTFGASGLGLLVASMLVTRSPELPSGLGYLGYLGGVLLLIIYMGRLIILTPTSPIVAAPAALAGFIVNPAWYIWLGGVLLRQRGNEAP